MTRKNKREIERTLKQLDEGTTDPDVGRPIETDLDEEAHQLLDDVFGGDPYGESGWPEWFDDLFEESSWEDT